MTILEFLDKFDEIGTNIAGCWVRLKMAHILEKDTPEIVQKIREDMHKFADELKAHADEVINYETSNNPDDTVTTKE